MLTLLLDWLRLVRYTYRIGRWRRHGKSRAPDPYWTRHRSGF
jgi:hypothetical protein